MPTDSPKDFGYYVIEPDLTLPKYALSYDAQVRCLCYLVSRIPDLKLAPRGANFKIISVQYTGPPYPAIGMYMDNYVDTPENLTRLTFVIGNELASLISNIGIDRLLELSLTEVLRWQDVL